MFGKIILWPVLSFALGFSVNAQTNKKIPKIGILNGRANYLPKPDYPQEAKDFCADGKVEVEVLISEKGDVIEAKAISGDELLRDVSVKAVKKAKFRQIADGPPTKIKGIVVYNFVPEQKCIVAGVVNKKALNIPKPQVANLNRPKQLQIKEAEIVAVLIIVDAESGKVIKARAISGHPMLRGACEISAGQTKFTPSFDVGIIPVKALLVYKFEPNGTVETDIEKDDKEVIGTPINLVEPPPPFCNCQFGTNPSVLVEVKIDEQGKVIAAKAFSGHPILKNICEKAALESKFLPTNIKAKIKIIYHFESIGEMVIKIAGIEIKEVKI